MTLSFVAEDFLKLHDIKSLVLPHLGDLMDRWGF